MRISMIVLFSAAYIFCQPASGQSFRADYESLVSLGKEFSHAEQGVEAALRDVAENTGAHRCMNYIFQRSSHLKDIFAYYQFSVAIKEVVKDQEDREKVSALLKTHTDLMQSDLEREHRRLKNVVTLCHTIPMAVTKGTEVLEIVEKGEAAVKSIADKL